MTFELNEGAFTTPVKLSDLCASSTGMN